MTMNAITRRLFLGTAPAAAFVGQPIVASASPPSNLAALAAAYEAACEAAERLGDDYTRSEEVRLDYLRRQQTVPAHVREAEKLASDRYSTALCRAEEICRSIMGEAATSLHDVQIKQRAANHLLGVSGQTFGDLIAYVERINGHSEGDEPAIIASLLMDLLQAHQAVGG